MLHVLNMSNTSPAVPCTLPLRTWMCLQVPWGCPTIQPVPSSLQQGEEVVEELVGQGRAFLAQLRAELDLDAPLEAVEPRWAPEEMSGIPAPSREPWDPAVLGLMWQRGVLLPNGPVPGQCPPAMFPLGFSYLSLLMAESAPREKRELVPTELPGVEEEEADVGRGKCPAAPGHCGMPYATMGTVTSLASASHPSPRAGCPVLVGQPLAIPPSTGTLCPCSLREWVVLPGAGGQQRGAPTAHP